MKSSADTFQVEPLRSRLALRTFICSSLARQLEKASFIEKPAITLRWEETLKDCHVLQLLVDLLERQKREVRMRDEVALQQGQECFASPEAEVH